MRRKMQSGSYRSAFFCAFILRMCSHRFSAHGAWDAKPLSVFRDQTARYIDAVFRKAAAQLLIRERRTLVLLRYLPLNELLYHVGRFCILILTACLERKHILDGDNVPVEVCVLAFYSPADGGDVHAHTFGIAPLWPATAVCLIILIPITLSSKENISDGYRRYMEAQEALPENKAKAQA